MTIRKFSDFYQSIKNKGDFARSVGCSHVHLWMVANGRRRASTDLAIKVEQEAGGHVLASDLLGLPTRRKTAA